MAHGFGWKELPAPEGQGAWFAVERAKATTGGARLLVTEGLGLQFQEGGEGSLGQAVGGRLGDLLHGVEVNVGARASLPKRGA